MTCAQAICDAVRSLGLKIRAGVHTGEIELAGDDIRGLAVHIGARIAAMAGPVEVLTSRTVKDLVVGSGLAFQDRGHHRLKAIPEDWQVFASSGERADHTADRAGEVLPRRERWWT